MMQEKIGGTALLLVKDTACNLKLDCDVRYVIECDLEVINEKDYQLSSKSEPIKMTLKRLVDACFRACYDSVFEGGVEYLELQNSINIVGEEIKNKIQPVLATCGVEALKVQICALMLFAESERLFQMANGIAMGSLQPHILDGPGMAYNPNQKVTMFNPMVQMTDAPNPFMGGDTSRKYENTTHEWTCECGNKCKGKFCAECGSPMKE